ncbi:MAB_1171c family putative transporter [Streptomyces katrae]|uniref:MAB_1171c family putative transporter n=1 Tax=Streptomyces katrae TaxID=68223 RepID=UPI0004BF72E4|nr:MAB_1171c family putative transporter [Streptomyces katrae]
MNDSNGLGFYIPGVLLLVAAGLKLPALWRNPRDELLRSVCILLALATAVFGFTAIPTIVAVNRITGVPNAAAPLVFSLLTAFSGANIVLIFRWSSGPEDAERTRRRSRLCNVVTLAVIAAINVLFALGDAPVERLRDLDTYYASTPYIREMILLYLAAHTTAAVTMTLLCWRWAREVHGALRSGLGLIAGGYVLNLLYDIAKFTAIGARWAGSDDWDALSSEIAPALASVSALLIATGFALPLISQQVTDRWRMWRRYRRLRPLSRELEGATRRSIDLAGGAWTSIEIRLTQRESDIHDGILAVSPYLQAGVREQALRVELEAGRPADEAAAVADAAALASAVVLWGRAQNAPGQEPVPWAASPVLTSPNSPQGLVRMSQALTRSATVRSCRRSAVVGSSTA